MRTDLCRGRGRYEFSAARSWERDESPASGQGNVQEPSRSASRAASCVAGGRVAIPLLTIVLLRDVRGFLGGREPEVAASILLPSSVTALSRKCGAMRARP